MSTALRGAIWTRVALAAALALAACTPENGPQMLPGRDCMECHGGRGGEEEGPRWTIAGTAFASPGASPTAGVQDLEVRVTDTAGKTLTLKTNGAGNFYSAEDVTFPLLVFVVRGANAVSMANAPGDCNRCHVPGGEAGGRIFIP